MRVITGDLWTVEAAWRIIPTNLNVRYDGTAVMGAGVALQAAQRYPRLSEDLGFFLRATDDSHLPYGQGRPSLLYHATQYRLTCLATKRNWR